MDALVPEFPPAEEAAWRKLVEKALRGAPWEALVGRTADGIALKPLYREAHSPVANDVAGAPGGSPVVRSAGAQRHPGLPWHIRQIVAHPDPQRANAEILADLEGGASSVELQIDPSGAHGIAIDELEPLGLALTGVATDLAPIALDARLRPLWAAELLALYLCDRNLGEAEAAFNIDPIAVFARTGATNDGALAAAASLAKELARDFPNASALRVDARPVHEAGGSEGQEIGAALATGIAYLRELDDAGVSIDEASRLLLFTFSVGADVLIETAKLRALRLCWAHILEASGANAGSCGARIHAATSGRMMTRCDAYTNILRTTAAAFAAAIGGAQSVSVRPFTDALGLPTPFARRIARNTQLVLMEECHLGHVVDPAGGAWFVEKLTRDLAEAGWSFMQKIEIEGGIVEALKRGWLQEEVRALREVRQRDFARRRPTITGVTDFPLLGAERPAIEQGPPPPRRFHDVTPVLVQETTCQPLPEVRWAAPFETLREKADAAGVRGVFFATLGPLADFTGRSNFARNLLAIGGVPAYEPEAVYESIAQMCADFVASGTSAAIIVGKDEAYERFAEDAARSLKSVGAKWILLAGRSGEREAAWRTAGIDQFVFTDCDVLEALEALHGALGIA